MISETEKTKKISVESRKNLWIRRWYDLAEVIPQPFKERRKTDLDTLLRWVLRDHAFKISFQTFLWLEDFDIQRLEGVSGVRWETYYNNSFVNRCLDGIVNEVWAMAIEKEDRFLGILRVLNKTFQTRPQIQYLYLRCTQTLLPCEVPLEVDRQSNYHRPRGSVLFQ